MCALFLKDPSFQIIYIYKKKETEISVQKAVAPGPGIEPRASCLPGRRANHYTIAALNANFCFFILFPALFFTLFFIYICGFEPNSAQWS